MKRLLVVEDNEQNLYFATYVLERLGYEVVQAHSGEVAMRLAMEHELDDLNESEKWKVHDDDEDEDEEQEEGFSSGFDDWDRR